MRLSIIHDIKSSILFYDFLKFHWHVLASHLNVDIAIALNEVISILSECGNLKEFLLTIATLLIHHRNPHPQTPVHLPNLRKLYLHMRILDQLVKLLKTPAVEDLLLNPLDEQTRLTRA